MTTSLTRALLLLLSSSSLLIPAQAQTVQGRVVAAATNKPVPYATVGVKGQPIGSTADEKGNFSFALPPALATTDSVVISCVGFRSVRLTVAQLRRPAITYELWPAVQALNEVHVRHEALKPGRLGRKFTFAAMQWEWNSKDTTDLRAARGWELTTVARVRKSCFIDSFHFFLWRNQLSGLRLRFVLYDVRNGKPGPLLLTDDIQFTVPDRRTGWIDLDLRRYNLHLRQGQTIATGIQWLTSDETKPQKHLLGGPCLLPAVAGRLLMRHKSESLWEQHRAQVAMYLDVQQYE